MFVNFGASLAATNPAWGLQVMYNTAPPGYGASTFAYSSAYLLGPQPGLSIGANQSWGAWAKIPGRWGGPTYGMCQSLNAGAAGVGRLAGGWGILDNPFALRLFFDQGDLAYRQYLEGQRAMREAGRPPETEEKKAPASSAKQAGDSGGVADEAVEPDIEAADAASGPAADPAAGLDPALRALLESAAGADAGAGADSDTGAETGEGE